MKFFVLLVVPPTFCCFAETLLVVVKHCGQIVGNLFFVLSVVEL
jgi:hypothetical protein